MGKRIIVAGFSCVFCLLLVTASKSIAKEMGKLYVIGIGPSGPDLTAPRGLEILQKADKVLCDPNLKEEFDQYIREDNYAFNPWRGGVHDFELQKNDHQKWLEIVKKRRKEVKTLAMKHIKKGQTVVVLDYGDPCVLGPALDLLLKDFPRRHLEVIPGMSAFNAASAALEQPMLGHQGLVVLTSPFTILKEKKNQNGPNLLKDLSRHKPTLVLYVALQSMDKLVKEMMKYYPSDFPAAVVYHAGFPDKEKVVRGRLGNINKKIKKYKEDWLGLVIFGKCLSR